MLARVGFVNEVFIKIGGGDISGVYFPAGWTIAKVLGATRSSYGIRATVEATNGAAFNINAISAGYMEFGLTQSDKLYQAVNGLAEWKNKGPQTELRAVFSLYSEPLTLVFENTVLILIFGINVSRLILKLK